MSKKAVYDGLTMQSISVSLRMSFLSSSYESIKSHTKGVRKDKYRQSRVRRRPRTIKHENRFLLNPRNVFFRTLLTLWLWYLLSKKGGFATTTSYCDASSRACRSMGRREAAGALVRSPCRRTSRSRCSIDGSFSASLGGTWISEPKVLA